MTEVAKDSGWLQPDAVVDRDQGVVIALEAIAEVVGAAFVVERPLDQCDGGRRENGRFRLFDDGADLVGDGSF
ncbi:hypothetical protein [Streptomyces sp. NBC_00467]|uniref:hypothetical protein n=1 Tax=Streptomyces sp. NBC_00467 TaxID=2975752 RepID=UPI002E16EE22